MNLDLDPKQARALLAFTGEKCKYRLDHVLVGDGCAIATDGHAFLRVPVPGATADPDACLIPGNALKVAMKLKPHRINVNGVVEPLDKAGEPFGSFPYTPRERSMFPDESVFAPDGLFSPTDSLIEGMLLDSSNLERVAKAARQLGATRLEFFATKNPHAFALRGEAGRNGGKLVMDGVIMKIIDTL